jgi:hypothetical protein
MRCNFDPFRTEGLVLGDQHFFLLLSPGAVLMIVHKVIVVSVPTLPSIPTRHVTGNGDPVADPELKNEIAEAVVFLGRELPAANISSLQSESHSRNELFFLKGDGLERKS